MVLLNTLKFCHFNSKQEADFSQHAHKSSVFEKKKKRKVKLINSQQKRSIHTEMQLFLFYIFKVKVSNIFNQPRGHCMHVSETAS